MPRRRIWRDGAPRPEAFSVEKSFAWGMELTHRRHAELGIEDQSAPVPPDLSDLAQASQTRRGVTNPGFAAKPL